MAENTEASQGAATRRVTGFLKGSLQLIHLCGVAFVQLFHLVLHWLCSESILLNRLAPFFLFPILLAEFCMFRLLIVPLGFLLFLLLVLFPLLVIYLFHFSWEIQCARGSVISAQDR